MNTVQCRECISPNASLLAKKTTFKHCYYPSHRAHAQNATPQHNIRQLHMHIQSERATITPCNGHMQIRLLITYALPMHWFKWTEKPTAISQPNWITIALGRQRNAQSVKLCAPGCTNDIRGIENQTHSYITKTCTQLYEPFNQPRAIYSAFNWL